MRSIALAIALAAGANLAAAQEAPNPAVIGLRLFSAICLDTGANLAAVAEASESYGLAPGALTDIPTTTRGPRNDPGVQIEGRPDDGVVFRGDVEGRPVVVMQYSLSQGRGRSRTTAPGCDLYAMGASEAEVAQLVPESMREGFQRTPFAFLTLDRRRFTLATSRLSRDSPFTEYGTMAYFSYQGPAPTNEGAEQ